MKSVCFVVPAHGRTQVSAVSFAELAWARDELAGRDVHAGVVVIADDENLELARAHGFATVERDNMFLGAKFNDGFSHAAHHGFDYAVPCGSDDWVHPDLIEGWLAARRRLQTRAAECTVMAARAWAAVSPDGRELALMRIPYDGGIGIRMFPTRLLARVGYRPVPEQRPRAIDGAIRQQLERKGALAFAYLEQPAVSVVDFKTDQQLNPYATVLRYLEHLERDTWTALAAHYPAALVEQAQALYAGVTA